MQVSVRWQFWKSPEDQPAWARPALLAIAAVATLLYAWNIANAGFEGFYSVAVKSMSVSWKAFFYGAFDPKATITLDKLAGSFVPQAISVRIFGFHAWSLALPQVIEGLISVLVMYRVVRRWAGPRAGLLAAGIFALTPVCVSMFGHSMEDGLLTMCLVLAADSCQRAMIEGRLRSLLWAAFWVGVGFQAKMMQAWIVLPALAAGYLAPPAWGGAPLPLKRRLRDAAAAGAACLAVSLSWIALYTLTPAHDRPYIDGSTNNSAISMVFGYNGLERFGVSFPGSVASMFGGGGRNTHVAGPVAEVLRDFQHAGGRPGAGWLKLAGSEFGPQIGWLFPLAFLALACGLLWSRRAGDSRRARNGAEAPERSEAPESITQTTRSSEVNHAIDPRGWVMWGVWLVTFGFVFSAMKMIPHTAYVASLAPSLAALSGAGIVMFWRETFNQESGAGGRRGWLLPVAVAAELGWSAWLWRSYRGFLPLAQWAIVIGSVAALVALAVPKLPVPKLAATKLAATKLAGRRHALIAAGALAGAAAMIAAPAAWAGSALVARYDGTEMNAIAGPAPQNGGFWHIPAAVQRMLDLSLHHGNPGWGGTSTVLTGEERDIFRYVTEHRHGAEYLMATQSWTQAAPYILATGKEVLPIGGFSGSVPSPTLRHFRHLVDTGNLRFFLLGGQGSGFMGRARSGQALAITTWVQHACTLTATTSLYQCSAHAGHGTGQRTRIAAAPRTARHRG
jgi:4-amino-4-deoxy-L-arabinose transferase-like glycosyltransferase